MRLPLLSILEKTELDLKNCDESAFILNNLSFEYFKILVIAYLPLKLKKTSFS